MISEYPDVTSHAHDAQGWGVLNQEIVSFRVCVCKRSLVASNFFIYASTKISFKSRACGATLSAHGQSLRCLMLSATSPRRKQY